MLRIATVEDDTNDLEALRTHLSRYEKENGEKADDNMEQYNCFKFFCV